MEFSLTLSDTLDVFLQLRPAKTVHLLGDFSHSLHAAECFKDANKIILTTPNALEPNLTEYGLDKLKKTEIFNNCVLDSQSGKSTFYDLSLNAASGLIPVEYLKQFWKNVDQLDSRVVNTITLETFYQSLKLKPEEHVNWLCYGGLSGLKIMAGLKSHFKHLDGILIKTIKEACAFKDQIGGDKTAIERFLYQKDFVRVTSFPTHHSAFEFDLYIRDHLQRQKKLETEFSNLKLEQAVDKNALESRICQSEKELAALSDKHLKLAAQKNALFGESKKLSQEVQKLLNKNQKQLEDIKQLSDDNQELSQDNQKQLENIKKLSADNQTLSEGIQKLSNDYASLSEKMIKSEAQEKNFAHLKHAIADLGTELRSDLTALSNAVDEKPSLIDAKIAGFETKIQSLDRLNRETHSLLDQEQNTLREIRMTQLADASRSPPEQINIWNRLADKNYKIGNFAKAAEYFQIVTDIDPDHGWAWQGIAESMARSANEKDDFWFVPSHRSVMDDRGRWDAVVRAYRNALKRDPNIGKKFNETYPPSEIKGQETQIDDPVFIVGCGHSGTSILLRILGNHKSFWPVKKESGLFLLSDEQLVGRMADWDRQCEAPQSKRWVEKTPPNIFQIPRLLAARTDAKIIIIVRDGRDVISSLKGRRGYKEIAERVDRWVYDNMAGMPYWGHEDVHVVKYEDLIETPVVVLTGICDFLDEPQDSNIFNFHQKPENWYSESLKKPKSIRSPKDHINLRNWQVNQPLFDGRGKWKSDLKKADIDFIKSSPAQDLLVKLKYVDGDDW